MATDPDFLALGNERFVSLATFRASGEAVATAVWIEREGDALIVTTPESSGKVKRLRSDPRVELTPCNRFGKVREGSHSVAGAAEIATDRDEGSRLTAKFREKYGLEYRLLMAIERVMKSGSRNRVILRVAPG